MGNKPAEETKQGSQENDIQRRSDEVDELKKLLEEKNRELAAAGRQIADLQNNMKGMVSKKNFEYVNAMNTGYRRRVSKLEAENEKLKKVLKGKGIKFLDALTGKIG